jgi:FkbM family methyltransferase
MPALLHRVSRAVMHCYPFANGQGRIIDHSFMGKLKFAEQTLQAQCRGGYVMDILPNDHIGRHLYLTGGFDPSIVKILRSFCTRGDERILDIGANVGSVSCALLHALPNCRIAAVEPQPAIYGLLEKNLSRVGGERARAVNVAVGDHEADGTMVLVDGNSGCSHVVDGSDATSNTAQIQIKLISGERLLEVSGLDRVDLIKIDVEGFEETVLRALTGTIERQKPRAVVFEHHGDLGDPRSAIRQIFDRCGYQLFGIKKSLMTTELLPIEHFASRGIRPNDYVAVAG